MSDQAPLPPPAARDESEHDRRRRADDLTRVKIFLGVQLLMLVLSAFTSGFQYTWWSMLDTALLIQAIGVTAMVPVLEEAWQRRLAFKVAVTFYLLGVADMGLNVLISGVVGWGRLFG